MFSRLPGKQYRLVDSDTNQGGPSYVADLLKVDGQLYLDLLPERPKSKKGGQATAGFWPMHAWYRVDQTGSMLRIAGMDRDWLEKHLTANPDALRHEIVDKHVVLTAKAEELQAFLKKHRDTPDAFHDPITFKRKPK